MALFANQDRWAFARGVNTTDSCGRRPALAGMSRATSTRRSPMTTEAWILQQQATPRRTWNIDSTPSFVINGQKYAGR